jgi:hypothetical protein
LPSEEGQTSTGLSDRLAALVQRLGEPDAHAIGPVGSERAFTRFADDLAWWTAAAKAQRARVAPPY